MRKPILGTSILLLVLVNILVIPSFSRAQSSNDIVLKVAISDYYKGVLDTSAIQDFETSNPGIKVEIINNSYLYPVMDSPDDQIYDIAQKFVSSADVLYISSGNLTDEMTRTGYFMDLTSFVKQDSSLTAADFYPAVWNSFQWNAGFWAIPRSLSVTLLMYDPAAFDKLKLAYPDGKWTLVDLKNALIKFAAASRTPTPVGQQADKQRNGQELELLRSSLGTNLFDSSYRPAVPKINTAAVAALMEDWDSIDQADLVNDGLTKIQDAISLGSPLAVENNAPKRNWSFLPGGRAGLELDGFAVSAGTQYPDKAYALARFLAARPSTLPESIPAQISTLDKSVFTPDQRQVIQQILDQAIPASDMRFTQYLYSVIDTVTVFKKSVQEALDAAQSSAEKALQLASNRRNMTVPVVASETPTPSLKAGEIWLKFGMVYTRPLPHADQWDNLIKTFVASDSQVRLVTIDEDDRTARKSDCLYLPYNDVPNGDLSAFASLDAFLNSDPSFDASDVVGNLLTQFQRNGKTWALPLEMNPQILRYNAKKFATAKLVAPQNGWNIAELEKDVIALKSAYPSSQQAPFAPGIAAVLGDKTFLLLISAYGGLPIDYRTSPPTLNFTDSATVAAIRKVLDFAKQGYIEYKVALVQNHSSSFSETFPIGDLPALSASDLTPNYLTMTDSLPVTFPVGASNPVAYHVGAGYIRASSPNPGACYRWLSLVAKHPELFDAMPVRRSLFNQVNASSESVALFQYFDKILASPNTVALQPPSGGSSSLIERSLYKAFDQYVLEKQDLLTALQTAEVRAKKVVACLSTVSGGDTSLDWDSYVKQYTDAENCYKAADPEYQP